MRMDMNILKRQHKLCICCMEEHDVAIVKVRETNIFKGQEVEYDAVYEYCEAADELYTADEMMSSNDIAMKDAYRRENGLLTSQEIRSIRQKYSISQSDLAILLDWGEKTITRYEGHQVQDPAHDTILKKINEDPEWFLQLLDENREKFSVQAYQKYRLCAGKIFVGYEDRYLQKTLLSQYAQMNGDETYCGGTSLNIPKIKEVIQYFANSKEMFALFKVKLMKLLWYSDSLSYKRNGHSITGLAYQKCMMGAVPVGHKIIMALDGVEYEEIDFPDDRIGYKFLPPKEPRFQALSQEDILVLDDVINVCGKDSKDEIVTRMHSEKSYIETEERALIQYQYAKELSIP